jgi:hypothetical protein
MRRFPDSAFGYPVPRQNPASRHPNLCMIKDVIANFAKWLAPEEFQPQALFSILAIT